MPPNPCFFLRFSPLCTPLQPPPSSSSLGAHVCFALKSFLRTLVPSFLQAPTSMRTFRGGGGHARARACMPRDMNVRLKAGSLALCVALHFFSTSGVLVPGQAPSPAALHGGDARAPRYGGRGHGRRVCCTCCCRVRAWGLLKCLLGVCSLRERERERESVCVCTYVCVCARVCLYVYVCVYVCVCVCRPLCAAGPCFYACNNAVHARIPRTRKRAHMYIRARTRACPCAREVSRIQNTHTHIRTHARSAHQVRRHLLQLLPGRVRQHRMCHVCDLEPVLNLSARDL